MANTTKVRDVATFTMALMVAIECATRTSVLDMACFVLFMLLAGVNLYFIVK